MTSGQRLRHRGSTIDIVLLDGSPTVLEHRDGQTRRYGAGEWFRLHRSGIALAHAYHRGDLGIEALLPGETIAALHATRAPRRNRVFRWLRRRVARWVWALRPAANGC